MLLVIGNSLINYQFIKSTLTVKIVIIEACNSDSGKQNFGQNKVDIVNFSFQNINTF